MVQILPNILEQEDFVKGLPDEYLYEEAQQPSGQVPPYLVISEIQRRTDMRERYTANQEQQPDTTIAQQIITEGLGGMGPISPQDNSSMLPTGMAPQTMGSPIPTDQTFQPLPAVASAGGLPPPTGGMALGSFGLGGMGGQPQGMSSGGLVGMQQAGRVPDQPSSQRDLAKGKYIVSRRGERVEDYTLSELVEIGRTDAAQDRWNWKSNLFGKDHPFWELVGGAEPEVDPAADSEVPYWKEKDYVPPLNYLDVLGGKSLTPEIAFEQKTGRDLDAPTRWEEASERYQSGYTPEEYPYFAGLEDWEKQELSLSERIMLSLREGAKRNIDFVGAYAPAVGEAVVDAATVFLTGDPSDPEAQRAEWNANRQSSEEWQPPEYGWEASPLYDKYATEAEQRALQSEYLEEAGISTEANRRLSGEWEPPVYGWEASPLYDKYATDAEQRKLQSEYLEGAGISTEGSYLDRSPSDVWDYIKDIPGRAWDFWKAGSPEPHSGRGDDYWRGRYGRGEEFADMSRIISGGATRPETADPRVIDGTRADDGTRTRTRDGTTIGGGTTIGDSTLVTGGGDLSVSARMADHRRRIEEIGVDAEEVEAEAMKDIASLITKTQGDAREDAFNSWLMTVGAGVAAGKEDLGLADAAQAINAIKKDARDAVRSLDATRLSRYFAGSKEELERAMALANGDAQFLTILINEAIENGRRKRAEMSYAGDLLRFYQASAMGFDNEGAIPALAEQQAADFAGSGLPTSQDFDVNSGRLSSGN